MSIAGDNIKGLHVKTAISLQASGLKWKFYVSEDIYSKNLRIVDVIGAGRFIYAMCPGKEEYNCSNFSNTNWEWNYQNIATNCLPSKIFDITNLGEKSKPDDGYIKRIYIFSFAKWNSFDLISYVV